VLAVVVGGFDAVTVGVVAAVLLRGALVRVTGESTWGGIVVCCLCLLCCIRKFGRFQWWIDGWMDCVIAACLNEVLRDMTLLKELNG
jgi:hypothetical protein